MEELPLDIKLQKDQNPYKRIKIIHRLSLFFLFFLFFNFLLDIIPLLMQSGGNVFPVLCNYLTLSLLALFTDTFILFCFIISKHPKRKTHTLLGLLIFSIIPLCINLYGFLKGAISIFNAEPTIADMLNQIDKFDFIYTIANAVILFFLSLLLFFKTKSKLRNNKPRTALILFVCLIGFYITYFTLSIAPALSKAWNYFGTTYFISPYIAIIYSALPSFIGYIVYQAIASPFFYEHFIEKKDTCF